MEVSASWSAGRVGQDGAASSVDGMEMPPRAAPWRQLLFSACGSHRRWQYIVIAAWHCGLMRRAAWCGTWESHHRQALVRRAPGLLYFSVRL